MTKQEFADLTAENIVYLDGATGSNLMKAGMPAGVCPEQWILDHPMVLQKLQQYPVCPYFYSQPAETGGVRTAG